MSEWTGSDRGQDDRNVTGWVYRGRDSSQPAESVMGAMVGAPGGQNSRGERKGGQRQKGGVGIDGPEVQFPRLQPLSRRRRRCARRQDGGTISPIKTQASGTAAGWVLG